MVNLQLQKFDKICLICQDMTTCGVHLCPVHLSSILPLVSQSREGLWVPEVRHTIYSMESLGRFWYYLKATQGPHCCMFNFRTAENSSRGRDIWREVPWEIVLQGHRAQPGVASVGTGWAEQSPKSAKKSLAWRPSMATTCDLNSSSSLPNCDATNILTVTSSPIKLFRSSTEALNLVSL